MTILDSSGRYLADMDEPAPRPAGPWLTNAAPRLEYVTPAPSPQCACGYNGPAIGVTCPSCGADGYGYDEAPASAEELAELANGRRV